MRIGASIFALFVLVALGTACASAGRFPELAEAERNTFHRCWYRVVESRCGAASLYQDDCTRSHRAEYAARDEAARRDYLGQLGCVVEEPAPSVPEPVPVPDTDTDSDSGTDTDTDSDSGTDTDTDSDSGTDTDTDSDTGSESGSESDSGSESGTGTGTGTGDVTTRAN